ncbi:uncharacterized protein LOC142182150 [Nicotiana tabacum]|uniref:Uncharacterized protein LOC142182150 n=1 Tax=Nicotiana tabacum TaxID=4097 RepID=A0AC58URX9_TOBAC
MPMMFWGDCMKTTTYLISKLPTKVLQGKCPYEVLHNKPAKIEHLRVFGCLCFASNLLGGDKFTPRAGKLVLIGYSKIQKVYRLYDLDSRKVFICRYVSFREQMFPFKKGTHITEDIFPWAESFVTNDLLPEQLEQGFSSKEHATTEDSNFSTTYDQVELAHDHISPIPVMESTAKADTQTIEPIETTINSVDTSAMHQPVEQVGVQPVTDPDTSQSYMEQVHTHDEAVVGKSSRITRPSIWLKDYVTPSNAKNHPHCISNIVSYSHLSANYNKPYLGVFSAIVEPKNFKEACQDENWVEVMSQEIKALEDNATWETVDLPAGKRAIGYNGCLR